MNLLYESHNSVIYHQLSKEYQKEVCIKQTKKIDEQKFIQLNNEYTTTKQLNIPNIRKVLAKKVKNGLPTLILTYFDGITLKKWFKNFTPTLEEKLEVAIQIGDTLGKIHQHKLIHRDVNPNNILINPQSLQINIIDFGLAISSQQVAHEVSQQGKLEGTLAYISPEQTGRIKQKVDTRTDLYALGVTLYELFTTNLPFDTKEATELVHAHLAKTPIPPQTITPDLPDSIGEIILKLLAKNAKDRYQSAQGVVHDLQICLAQWQTTKSCLPFPLARHDFSGKLEIPNKLYGREQEIGLFHELYQQVYQNKKTLLLLEGSAGVGKSSFIHEAYRTLPTNNGYFIKGKFEQFQQDIPYFAWIQAFEQFINYILSESKQRLQDWKQKILQAVGKNGQLLTNVLPSLQLIIGKQPMVTDVGMNEAQHRFKYTFLRFAEALSSHKHPLTIFIDDLQWADDDSIALFQLLLQNQNSHHILLIGAYRPHDITPIHELPNFIKTVKEKQTYLNIQFIALANLPQMFIYELLKDTLSCSQNIETLLLQLANCIYDKTNGNPFYVQQFLLHLYEEDLLSFDNESMIWVWDIQKIESLQITENLLELVINKIQRLPFDMQQTLQLAACFRGKFSLDNLQAINQNGLENIQVHLQKGILENLLIPTHQINTYYFAHDEIQKAIYSVIPTDEKENIHLAIAKLLASKVGKKDLGKHIFDITSQWNLAHSLLATSKERYHVANLNWLAGQKTKQANAYQASFNYLKTSIDLLKQENAWRHKPDFTLQVYTDIIEVAYLLGDFSVMDKFIKETLPKTVDLLAKVPLFELQIQGLIAQQKLEEALKLGINTVQQLGLPLPNKVNGFHIVKEVVKTKVALSRKNFTDISNLPSMKDPYKLAIMRILVHLNIPMYSLEPTLLLISTLKQVQLSIQFGNAPQSVSSYGSYGYVLSGGLGSVQQGYQFGNLALLLGQKSSGKKYLAKAMYMFNAPIKHWKDPLQDTLTSLQQSYQVARELGDIESAALSLALVSSFSFYTGSHLQKAEKQAEKHWEAIKYLNNETFLRFHEITYQTILQLRHLSAKPYEVNGDKFDATSLLTQQKLAQDSTLLLHFYVCQLQLSYLFGNQSAALNNILEAEKYLEAGYSMPVIPIFHLYTTLVYARQYMVDNQKKWLKKIQTSCKKMNKWAANSPENYAHKAALMEAELYRLKKQPAKARTKYDEAIDLAQKHHFTNEEALANEVAAQFYQTINQKRLMEFYLKNAYQLYHQWGAKAKMRQLIDKHKNLALVHATANNFSINALRTSSTTNGSDILDLSSILKISQTLSKEVVLENLLRSMMRILIESAGAEEVVLLQINQKKAFIQGEANIHRFISVLQNIPLEECKHVPVNIIHYGMRTQKPLVLADAIHDKHYKNNPYIAKKKVRSLLCLPIRYKNKIRSIIYLENNVVTGAFTEHRLQFLQMISAQMIISLENALVYQNLETKVKERTHEIQVKQKEIAQANEQLKTINQNLESIVQERTAKLQVANQNLHKLNKELLHRNKNLQQFTYIVSHNLRAPIANILGLIQLYNPDEPSDPTNQLVIDNVKDASNTLDEVLTDLNSIISLQSEMNEVKEMIPLPTLFKQLLLSIDRQVQQGDVTIVSDFKQCKQVYTIKSYIHSILLNLLTNAIKYKSPKRKAIIQVTCHLTKDNYYCLQVSDNGLGIDLEKHGDNLFKLYKRFHFHVEGKGLGLHLVQTQVEALDGIIEVDSQLDVGTTFKVLIKKELELVEQ